MVQILLIQVQDNEVVIVKGIIKNSGIPHRKHFQIWSLAKQAWIQTHLLSGRGEDECGVLEDNSSFIHPRERPHLNAV